MKLLKSAVALLVLITLAAATTIPSRSQVVQVINKQLGLVDGAVSAQQKVKIWESVNTFSAQNADCPGYTYPQGSGHVTTTNRLGALFQAGFEAVFKGQIKTAAWCFLQALKLNCDCPVLLSNAAFSLNRTGQHADALTLLNYAVSLDPTFASAWVNIASAASALKQFETAKKALQMAIALNPEIKDYQDLLKGVYAASGSKKKVETADLDSALDILGQGKSTSGQTGGTSAKPQKKASRPSSGDAAESLVSGMGSSFQSDMSILGQFIPILAQAGGQYLKESQWHEQKSKETSGTSKNVHFVGAVGMELISQLFKGYIADISGSWDYADDLVQKTAKSIPDRPADYDPSKGLRPETKIPSLSIGFDGIVFKIGSDEIECEIGEGIIFGFSYSSQGWSVKIGLGLQMQAGFMTGGGVAYFLKYDSQGAGSIKGEAKAEILSFGAKAETTFSETTLYSFEDTGGVKSASKK